MKNITNLEQWQETFSRNIWLCKTVFFGLTYEDIKRYTDIPQPTMYSYDKYGVSPYISVAKQIAEFYCTDLDTLCRKELSYYIVDRLNMLKQFVVRVGGNYTAVTDKMSTWIDKQLQVAEYVVYEELCKQLKIEIADLNNEKRAVEIKRDEKIVENFTKNFDSLHRNLGVSYRKISSALDISIGNLTRLKKGGEPMLETVIKLSSFFGVGIEQMIANEPEFEYINLQKDAGKFNVRFGEVPSNDIRFYDKMRANLLSKEEAKELAAGLLIE